MIETKNFTGTLLFNDLGQFIHILNERQEGYSDPVAQAQYHQLCLRNWLSSHHFPALPVDSVLHHQDGELRPGNKKACPSSLQTFRLCRLTKSFSK